MLRCGQNVPYQSLQAIEVGYVIGRRSVDLSNQCYIYDIYKIATFLEIFDIYVKPCARQI